jgi:uncharacterized membrane protein YidH (DUF202 family)
MVDVSVVRDMSRQRKLQFVTGLVAILGIVLWFFNITVLSVNPGEFIAALAIIIFAVATIHWVDDEEKIEEEKAIVKKE